MYFEQKICSANGVFGRKHPVFKWTLNWTDSKNVFLLSSEKKNDRIFERVNWEKINQEKYSGSQWAKGSGGKQMDMIMDRLPQKLTAQDIIKANTAAETEELKNLRNQLAAYNDCLERLQRLIREGETRLAGARQIDNGDVRYLLEESVSKIRALQQDTGGMEKLQRQLTEQLHAIDKAMVDQLCNMDKAVADQIAGIDKNMEGRLTAVGRTMGGQLAGVDKTMEKRLNTMTQTMSGQIAGIDKTVEKRLTAMSQNVGGHIGDMSKTVDEKLDGMDKAMSEKLDSMDKTMDEKLDGMGKTMEKCLDEMNQSLDGKFTDMGKVMSERLDALSRSLSEQAEDSSSKQLTEGLEALNENVHKECVKVYRNVQAVVVEESGKQSSVINEAASTLNGMKGKQGAILGLCAATLIISLASMAMQILGMLNII